MEEWNSHHSNPKKIQNSHPSRNLEQYQIHHHLLHAPVYVGLLNVFYQAEDEINCITINYIEKKIFQNKLTISK
jgi:hypothetical protein